MASIREYLTEFGSLSLEMNPFNPVDGLIFAQLSYMNFDGVVDTEPVPLQKACALMLQKQDFSSMYHFMQVDDARLLVFLGMRKRFADVVIGEYVNVLDDDKQEQFSAITADFPAFRLVAFRGTDASLAGWKEDFNMAFASPVPAQLKAVEYVNRAGNTTEKPLVVCGHSKGGNLAVYGASFCEEGVQDRITAVYSYDGPGLTPEQASDPAHVRLMPRISVMIPRGSFVGTLFEQTDDVLYVESSAVGLMQHYSYNWQVEGMGFVRAEKPTDPSAFMTGAMRELVASMDMEERRLFVEALYSILSASEATDLVTLFNEWQVRSIKMLRYYKNLDKSTRDVVISVVRKFLKAAALQVKFGE